MYIHHTKKNKSARRKRKPIYFKHYYHNHHHHIHAKIKIQRINIYIQTNQLDDFIFKIKSFEY